MGGYGTYRRGGPTQEEEALTMHRYWEERYLILMMTSVDGDTRKDTLINRAEASSKYWLDKYNALTLAKD